MHPYQPIAGVPILQALRVSKSFAGVKALVDVSLTLWLGEVHALMGGSAQAMVHGLRYDWRWKSFMASALSTICSVLRSTRSFWPPSR